MEGISNKPVFRMSSSKAMEEIKTGKGNGMCNLGVELSLFI